MKLANALTISRIVLAPVIFVFIILRMWVPAVVLLAAGFATDIADGYIARRFNQKSAIGRTLDPLADRLLIFFALVGLLIVFGSFQTNWIYGIMFFSKDIIYFFLMIFARAGLKKVRPRKLGRVVAFFQGATVFWIILGLPNFEVLIYIVFILGLISGIDYFLAFRQKVKNKQ